MKTTYIIQTNLYSRLIKAERTCNTFESHIEGFVKASEGSDKLYETAKNCIEQINQFSIPEYQKSIMDEYSDNPILSDAINSKQTIEESLLEIAKVNKGINKFLPRKKDKIHNDRVEHIAKLISEPFHLYKKGFHRFDNVVTTAVYTTGMSVAISCAAPVTTKFMSIYGATVGLLMGISINSTRFKDLPVDQAKYLDNKVQELYK